MFRRGRNDIENHIIDEYAAGRIDRREFIRRGTVAGLSLPMLSLLVAACGGANNTNSASSAAAGTGGAASTAAGPTKTGGTIRLGITTPSTEVDPVLNGDTGGLAMLAMTGEFLCVDENKQLTPWLAESWTSNADASEWTFKIRQGVNFNDGTPMTAKDVAASINRLSDPANKSNALSAFTGVLSKGSATAPDDATVVFKLDAPNGSFPYYLSSDNYNAIILPAAYAGNFTKTFPGTGPWKMASYTAGASASFVRNDGYWGKKAIPDKLDITFAADEGAQILALQGGQLDVVQQVSVSGAQAILNDPKYNIITLQSSAHRQLSMRCDTKPFTDARVRQAIALSIDRKAIVDGLFQGKSDLGNDSPFAPVFAQTDTSVPQRAQDIAKAKQLLSDAGKSDLKVTLQYGKLQEIPDLAVLLQSMAAPAGITITPAGGDNNPFYDLQWCPPKPADPPCSGAAEFGIVDYGHRATPDVFLNSAFKSKGVWNSSQYSSSAFDAAFTEFQGAAGVDAQKAACAKIETIMNEDVPVALPYWYNYLSGNSKKFTGVYTCALGQMFLSAASAV
jgi:peptide/nickel transport system substrate-binding protein